MRREWSDRFEAVVFIGAELALGAFLVKVLSWPLPLVGKVLFGIIGAWMALFIFSLWRWSVFYRQARRSDLKVSSSTSSGIAALGAEAKARFWLRLNVACWGGIMLTLLAAGLLVRFGGLGRSH